LVLTNRSARPLRIEVPDRATAAFPIGGAGVINLAPSGQPDSQDDITVYFDPRRPGDYAAQLVIKTNDATQPTVGMPLKGKALDVGIIVQPATATFGRVPVGVAEQITLTFFNVATPPVKVTVGNPEAPFSQTGGGTFTLAPVGKPGDRHPVTVTFKPTAPG